MVHQVSGVPGRAPGPHATRPLIATTMQRVVACAAEARCVLSPVVDATLSSCVQDLLVYVERPQYTVDRNTIGGCMELVERYLVEQEQQVERTITGSGGVARIRGEEFVAYLTRVAGRISVRGAKREAILAAAKHGLAVAEIQESVDDGRVYEALERAWSQPARGGSVTDVIAAMRRRGIDGEAVCWSVVNRESLNHVLLVKREANRMVRLWPERKADDLVGYGWRGLRLALRSYNPETAWFSTYACPKIRGAIRDGVRNEHHLPKRLSTFVNKAERAKDELNVLLGRHPTRAEVAERLETEIERVAMLPMYVAPQSLDVGEDEHGIQIIGVYDVEAQVLAALDVVRIESALADLPEDEAEAVRLLVMEQVPMREVHELTGASPKQLRARRDRGLAALRNELEDEYAG